MPLVALIFLVVQAVLLLGGAGLAAWGFSEEKGKRSGKFLGAAILIPLAMAPLLIINPLDFLLRFKQVIVIDTVKVGNTTYTLTQVPDDDFYMTFLERSSRWDSARAMLDYDNIKIWYQGNEVQGSVIVFHCLPAHGDLIYDTANGEFVIGGAKRNHTDLNGYFAMKPF
jgi:hypothetical protein